MLPSEGFTKDALTSFFLAVFCRGIIEDRFQWPACHPFFHLTCDEYWHSPVSLFLFSLSLVLKYLLQFKETHRFRILQQDWSREHRTTLGAVGALIRE